MEGKKRLDILIFCHFLEVSFYVAKQYDVVICSVALQEMIENVEKYINMIVYNQWCFINELYNGTIQIVFSDPSEISLTQAEASNFSESQTASVVTQETVSKESSPQTRSDTAEQPASAAPSEIHISSNAVKEKSAEETAGDDNSKFVQIVNNAHANINDT